MGELIIGKQVNRWQLFTSLLLIFSGAVIASKFDDGMPLLVVSLWQL